MGKSEKINRREFIRNSALVVAGAEMVSAGSALVAGEKTAK